MNGGGRAMSTIEILPRPAAVGAESLYFGEDRPFVRRRIGRID